MGGKLVSHAKNPRKDSRRSNEREEREKGLTWKVLYIIANRYILAHSKFHGIPRNCSCPRNWCTPSSMEFHGIPWNCSGQWNWRTASSMEFHGIPWNFSCQRNWRTPSSTEFNEIPWNCSSHRNWRTQSSMEFHGIPWNCSCHRNRRTPSSMEFHVIPWNCSFQRNWRILSSMAFHGIPWNFGCANFDDSSSSMEFQGTALVIEIGALLVPWNSMELLESSKLAHPKFHGIPWNCSCHRNWRTTSSMEFHGTSRVSEVGAF